MKEEERMGNDYGGYSLSDIAAATGNGRGGGNGGFGDGSGAWLIILFLIFALGGWNRGGFGGGSGGGGSDGGISYIPYNVGGGLGGGFSNEYAWLSNGQKEIMQNTNNGFNALQLTNQLTGISSGVQNLSTQLCNCCADMNQTVNAGFANAETAANARQMANMQQSFNNQMATSQGFNSLGSQLADCCCENRLATANLTATVLSENCADRAALQEGVRDIIQNQTFSTQRILDQLCNDKIDAKNEKIADLERQLTMADLRASQIQQTAQIRAGQETANTELLNLLNTCPIPSTPVYGRTPIFTCQNNNGCGCGCNGNNNLF